jgi:hypothetical protein
MLETPDNLRKFEEAAAEEARQAAAATRAAAKPAAASALPAAAKPVATVDAFDDDLFGMVGGAGGGGGAKDAVDLSFDFAAYIKRNQASAAANSLFEDAGNK